MPISWSLVTTAAALALTAALGCGTTAEEPHCVCDAAITKLPLGPVTAGGQGAFGILVDYSGHPLCDDGDVCVTDHLAAGLTLASASPSAWSCTQTGADVRCCHAGPLPPTHVALPMLVLTVDAAAELGDRIENCAQLEQGEPADFVDEVADNNRSCTIAPVQHLHPDLLVQKRHVDPFVPGSTGVFEIGVSNIGTGPAPAPTVTDTLDPAFTYVASSGPWSCTTAGQLVTCTYTGGAVPAQTSLPPLELTVQIAGATGDVLENCAIADLAGDPTPRNNRSCDTLALACAPLELDLSTGISDATGAPIAVGGADDTWRVVSSPDGVDLGAPRVVSFWNSALPGSAYVSPRLSLGGGPSPSTPMGTYVYETCFCLGDDFSDPSLALTLRADNLVQSVSLNGCVLPGSTGGAFNGAPLALTTTEATCFQPGDNCVRVEVRNDGSYTGLDVSGAVTATNHGACCGP